MYYSIVEVSVVDEIPASAVTVKENLNEARMVFHQIRASQLANPNVTYGMASVLDYYGHSIMQDSHEVVKEPEPPEEPTGDNP